jgi:hypothetical protein
VAREHWACRMRLRRCSPTTRSGALTCPPPPRAAVVVSEGGAGRRQGLHLRLLLPPVLLPVPPVAGPRRERTGLCDVGYLSSCLICFKDKNTISQCKDILMLISSHRCNGKYFLGPPASLSVRCLNIAFWSLGKRRTVSSSFER